MNSIGPTYCETGGAFFVEPVNTVTNLASLLAAFFIVYMLHRRGASSGVWRGALYVLAGLLATTGLASFLWHGFKSPFALSVDVLGGVLYLLVFLFLWAWSVRGRWTAYGLITALLIGVALVPYLIPGVWSFSFFAILGVLLVIGGILLFMTYREHGKKLGHFALLTIASAALAFFFRSIDLWACPHISFGTHFLWHIFLSIAALMGAWLVLTIVKHR